MLLRPHCLLRWPRTLRHKSLLAIALVALLALANVVTMQQLLRRSDSLAATLNVAGKMRMLSQHIPLEALASPQVGGGLEHQGAAHWAEFDAAITALRGGGPAFGLQVPPLDAWLHPRLERLAASALALRQTLTRLERAPQESERITLAMTASDALLAQTEVLMDTLVQHADALQQNALHVTLLLFTLDLLLLALCYALLSRRVLRPVRRLTHQCRAMEQGSYVLHAPLAGSDELGELSRALNRSAAQIAALLQDVAQREAMFQGLAHNDVAGIYLLSEDYALIYVNAQMTQITGHAQASLAAGFPLARLFLPEDWPQVQAHIAERLRGTGHGARFERRLLRANGDVVDVEIFSNAMEHQGRPAIIGMMVDISERKRAEAGARRAALVYAHTHDAIVVTDAAGVVQDVNPAFTRITGYAPADILGRRMNMLSSGRQDQAFYQAMWNELLASGSWSGDVYNRKKSGEEFTEHLQISTSYNPDGSVHCRIGLFSDVTEERAREATIWHQAHYDHLTQLPNRQLFEQSLLQSMEHTRRSGVPFALLFLDLDFFKTVNDTFGHDEGDELLRQVARRLLACVRASDQVARLGGDEFTVLLQDIKQPEDAHHICRKLLHAIAQPYQLGYSSASISVSSGVVFYPRDGADSETLLKNADLAMYASKDKGRNQFSEFTPAMEQEEEQRLLLLRALRQGLDEEEFVLHYQPIVEMASGRIAKAEALLRWQPPLRGSVSPAEFIPAAEESGLIVPLGDWVLREATRQLAQWRAQVAADFSLSVNVSPAQLHAHEQDVRSWLAHLAQLELPAQALVLEITERLLLEPDREADAKLRLLQDAGVQLALDDFGTGYSSLTHLKRFDIDLLKIDRSFVQQLAPGNDDAVLCQAIIAMAHQLGIRVVAEGVEMQAQHDLLLDAGCDLGQGYWYGRPMPAPAFEARLHAQR